MSKNVPAENSEEPTLYSESHPVEFFAYTQAHDGPKIFVATRSGIRRTQEAQASCSSMSGPVERNSAGWRFCDGGDSPKRSSSRTAPVYLPDGPPSHPDSTGRHYAQSTGRAGTGSAPRAHAGHKFLSFGGLLRRQRIRSTLTQAGLSQYLCAAWWCPQSRS